MIGLQHRRVSVPFPSTETPAWSNKVERWYQLDAFAYSLCEAYFQWRNNPLGSPGPQPRSNVKSCLSTPHFVILASPGASNETDWRFVASGASSPSKFVHTLPNVRLSSLCQLMEWTGPSLCFHKDPRTLSSALEEGVFLSGPAYPVIWILNVVHAELPLSSVGPSQYEVNLFELFYSPLARPGTNEFFGLQTTAPGSDSFRSDSYAHYLRIDGAIPGEEAPENSDDALLMHWLFDETRKEGAVHRLSSACTVVRTIYI